MKLGSKIDNLNILKYAGINVPNFIAIKSEDMIDEDFFEFNYNEEDRKNSSKNLKKKIEENFKKPLIELGEGLYSVRSSCNYEDGKNHSFAGLFDTYLNVPKKDVNKKVRLCYESLYNENVLEYVKDNNIDLKKLRMNVIIQKMVKSELSGIIFTANPQGILNESVIVVGRGLGENVVSDKVDTTSYYYNLDDDLYYYEGKEELLDLHQIKNLIEISKKIKNKLGKYLDIEFAISEGKIYILQARNITNINDKNILIMDNSNIVESYPGINLPITCSFANDIYTGVFRGLCRRILNNKKIFKKLRNTYSNMVGDVNGRMYYKISNWYQLIKLAPFSKRLIPIWQEMLGVKNKDFYLDEIKITKIDKIKIDINFIYNLITVSKKMDKLNKEFSIVNTYYKKEKEKGLKQENILKIYNKISKDLLSVWDITLINDMYAFIYTFLAKKRLNKKYFKDNEITNKYISGIKNIESLKPVKELVKLSLNYSEMDKKTKEEKVKEYIEKYGDRNIEELKIETKTFRTNPELLNEQINLYMKDLKNTKKLIESLEKNKEFEDTKMDIITKYLLKKCKKGIRNREISRLNRTRIFGIVRDMVVFLGKEYKNENIIEDVEDIYYLKLGEIFELLNKKQDMKKLISKRKNEYKVYEMLPGYSRMIFMNKEFNKNHMKVNSKKIFENGEILKGIPCSDGIVKGEAVVIKRKKDLDNINNLKNKILITKYTDPGWVFVLSSAKGVISEKGSMLSHTAIISRELKIPSIVGVYNILDRVETGDVVEMNGNLGEIKVVMKKDDKMY